MFQLVSHQKSLYGYLPFLCYLLHLQPLIICSPPHSYLSLSFFSHLFSCHHLHIYSCSLFLLQPLNYIFFNWCPSARLSATRKSLHMYKGQDSSRRCDSFIYAPMLVLPITPSKGTSRHKTPNTTMVGDFGTLLSCFHESPKLKISEETSDDVIGLLAVNRIFHQTCEEHPFF